MPNPITTDATLARDLKQSLVLREGVPAGNTWGQFKAAMTLLGVRDDDRIASIEYGCSQWTQTGRIMRDEAADGIEIKERR